MDALDRLRLNISTIKDVDQEPNSTEKLAYTFHKYVRKFYIRNRIIDQFFIFLMGFVTGGFAIGTLNVCYHLIHNH